MNEQEETIDHGPVVVLRPGVPFGLYEGAECDVMDAGVRYAVRVTWRESGYCLLSEDETRYWPLIGLWRWRALANRAYQAGDVQQQPGRVYLVGVLAPGAEQLVEQLMADPAMLLIDIRAAARSRWFPWCNKSWLLARWGTRYTHERDLSNVNYRDPAQPVQLRDPDRSVAGAIDLLGKGLSLCLLCACRGNDLSCACRVVVAAIAAQLDGTERRE